MVFKPEAKQVIPALIVVLQNRLQSGIFAINAYVDLKIYNDTQA